MGDALQGFDDIEKKEDIGPLLASPGGLQELVKIGALAAEEVNALQGSGLDSSQYPYILLEWVGIHVLNGLELGLLGRRGVPNSGFEGTVLNKLSALRGEYFSIGDSFDECPWRMCKWSKSWWTHWYF